MFARLLTGVIGFLMLPWMSLIMLDRPIRPMAVVCALIGLACVAYALGAWIPGERRDGRVHLVGQDRSLRVVAAIYAIAYAVLAGFLWFADGMFRIHSGSPTEPLWVDKLLFGWSAVLFLYAVTGWNPVVGVRTWLMDRSIRKMDAEGPRREADGGNL